MRRGERRAWRDITNAAYEVSESRSHAEEYMAKIELRAAWARLYGIPHVSGLPRAGSLSAGEQEQK